MSGKLGLAVAQRLLGL